MISTHPINHSNDIHIISAVEGSLVSSHFVVYQLTTVGSSDFSKRTLVPVAISAVPYRKALITTIFFRQILALADTLPVSFSTLMTTVASYFSLNTDATEREVEAAVAIICSIYFVFFIYRALAFFTIPGNQLRSRT